MGLGFIKSLYISADFLAQAFAHEHCAGVLAFGLLGRQTDFGFGCAIRADDIRDPQRSHFANAHASPMRHQHHEPVACSLGTRCHMIQHATQVLGGQCASLGHQLGSCR